MQKITHVIGPYMSLEESETVGTGIPYSDCHIKPIVAYGNDFSINVAATRAPEFRIHPGFIRRIMPETTPDAQLNRPFTPQAGRSRSSSKTGRDSPSWCLLSLPQGIEYWRFRLDQALIPILYHNISDTVGLTDKSNPSSEVSVSSQLAHASKAVGA